jgi:hypothetical protein
MTGLIAIGGLAVLIFLLVLFVVTRIKVAGPNEAFIVTGRKGKEVTNPETGRLTHDLSGQRVVMGASIFVLPVVQRLAILDLTSRQLAVSVPAAIAKNGIRCSLEGRRRGQGRRPRGLGAGRGPALPRPAAGHRPLHQGGPGRRPAGHRRPAHRRGDHPRPGHLRRRRHRGGRVEPDQPGPGARHLPAPGHPGRGPVPRRPGPPRGRPGRQGRRHRRGRRPPGGGGGPAPGRGGDRRGQPGPRPPPGRDPGPDRRRRGRCRGRRTAGPGGPRTRTCSPPRSRSPPGGPP